MPKPSAALIALLREDVEKFNNRSDTSRKFNVPRATVIAYTRDIPGSPKGGGRNPIHADRHPEWAASGAAGPAQATMGDVAHRPGREPIEVTGDPTGAALRAAEAVKPEPEPTPEPVKAIDFEKMMAAIRKRPTNAEDLSKMGGVTRGAAIDWLDGLKAKGFNVRERSGHFSIDKDVEQSYLGGPSFELVSEKDNTFHFGAMGDTHIGSKYARIDCLHKLYDRYAEDGIATVFNGGNWIEGEARFNKFDLDVHGMDAQLRYLAEQYPQRDGMKTYAVAGDDHEGWYGQQVGANIGKYAQNAMRDEGRSDWFDLGYMESHVKLTNANTGKSAVLAVVHPGGGSSYALSYTSQKLVESYDGGEKPAVLLMAHYHKLWSGNIRNVWVCQTGCFQDQTPFMRKKRLEAHVGGAIIKLRQDPETGAIIEFMPNLIRYFNKAYYSNRWSHSGPVVLPDRS